MKTAPRSRGAEAFTPRPCFLGLFTGVRGRGVLRSPHPPSRRPLSRFGRRLSTTPTKP